MKLQFKTSPTSSSGDMDVSKMGLAEESKDLFAQFLRNQIYTDKILAPIREYICNAVDISIDSNSTKPVEVAITKQGNQYIWSCRDYGSGLDEEDIRNIFAMYGRSSKRSSNSMVGCFGVGSKAFFGYTDSYFVNSYYNNTLTKYVCMLGAGDNGVPVGEIYKVSEEPTTETGLEISADVTKNYYDFDIKTKQFINRYSPDANIVYTNMHGETFQPAVPMDVETIDGYVFNRYGSSVDFGYRNYPTREICIRMGGVVYKSDLTVGCPTINGTIIVDVPIGKLSIPISRESLEMTPSNTKVFDAIRFAINTLSENNKKLIIVPNFAKTVLSDINRIGASFSTGWFKYGFTECFPDSKGFMNLIRISNPESYSATYDTTATGKHIVYVVPNIKSFKNWVTRLKNCLKDLGKNTNFYYVLDTPHFQTLKDGATTLDVSDCIFTDVKTLGLPRIKSGGPQVVYQVIKNGTKYGPWTSEELEEYVAKRYYNGDEIDSEWYKSAKTMSELNRRTIGLVKEWCNVSFWLVNSTKLRQQMLDIGWIARNSLEYTTQREEILAEERRIKNMEVAEDKLKSNMFYLEFAPRVIQTIGKYPDKLNRLISVKKKIMSEDSPRARILKSMDRLYSTHMTRDDMRIIMKLK